MSVVQKIERILEVWAISPSHKCALLVGNKFDRYETRLQILCSGTFWMNLPTSFYCYDITISDDQKKKSLELRTDKGPGQIATTNIEIEEDRLDYDAPNLLDRYHSVGSR